MWLAAGFSSRFHVANAARIAIFSLLGAALRVGSHPLTES